MGRISPGEILITGATGTIARDVALALKARGHAVRALVRTPEKAITLRNSGVEIVVGDFERRESLRDAFHGVGSAFLLTPAHAKSAEWCSNAITVAKESGSPHIVRLSALKAAEDGPTDNTRLHGSTDRELRESGLPHTILRPNYFMQNFIFTIPTLTPAVHEWLSPDDVADAIFWSLSQPEHVEISEIAVRPVGQAR